MVGALALSVGPAARAGTFTWTGNSSSSWATPGNWSPSGPPSTSDDVVVAGANAMSLNTGATITVASFKVNGYSNTVTQNASTPLHVTGVFAIGTTGSGTFTASGASSVQIDGASTISVGTFNGNGATITMTGGLTVSGGTFNSTNGPIIKIPGGLTVSGGTYNANASTLTVGSLSVSSGTFTGATATIVDTGGVSLTGGAFSASSGTMQIGGVFSHSASDTFTDNGGTFLFNSSTSRSHTFGGALMPNVVINDGLAAYWTLDDGSGNPTDSSGYGNTLTRSTTLTWGTTVSSAITFSDPDMVTFSGSYATDATPAAMPAANAAQTISLWAQFASSTATQAMLALNGSSSAIVLGLGGGNVRVWKNSSADLAHVAAPTDGKWHHIAYTTTGAADTLYVDGVATAGLGTAHDSGAVTAVFMGAANTTSSFYAGSLDDVRVYTRALTAREVADLAFGHAPSTGVATHTFSDAFTTNTLNGLTIASGVVAGTAAVTVGGDWLNYGGRFTNTTGTVTLNGTGTRTLLTGGQPFANLTVNTTGIYDTDDRLWMAGKTLNISGQANSFGPGAVVTVGALNDTTPNSNGLSGTTGGTVVLDGTSDLALAEKNFWGLRIEDPSETGLVSYWKLDEGQYTSVRDYVGSNNGTLSASGATWTSPPALVTYDDAAAIKLNGTSGWVSLGTATSLPSATSAQTISLWFKLAATSGTQDFLVLGNGSHGTKIGLNGGVLAAFTWGGTSIITATTPTDGGWHNLVFSYDGTNNKLYLDGAAVSPNTNAHDAATITVAALGSYDGSHELFNGALDDVRVYSTALTAAQVGQLAKGRYAGTGGLATVTQTGVRMQIASTSGAGLFLDSGNYYTNDQTVTVSALTSPCVVNSGTLHIGSAVVNCDGGLTINPMGTLLMDTSGGQFQPGKNSTVAIDGAFTASSSALVSRDNNNETYSFQIGTFSGSTPVLDISGLEIRFADSNGVQIDNIAGVATGAVTTYKHFDNILFRQAPAGALQMLEIYAKTLNLSSSGCTFGKNADNNFAAVAVKLIGNGTGDGETRAIFGGTTCQTSSGAWTGGGTDKICVAAAKSDDDSDGNGIADSATAGSNGAIAQFVRAAEDDTAGTVVGLPTSAFNWNTFTYYSTYVAFHNASGGSKDVIYVRDELGNPLYSWPVPNAGETITGTPQWITTGSTHYVFVATSAGNVYKLIDTATGDATGSLSLDTVSTNWKTKNPYSCGCTISTPLGMDASNLYWGSTTSGENFWTLGQASQSGPFTVSFSQAVTNTGISVATIGSTPWVFMGVAGAILQIPPAGSIVSATNSSPGTHSVFGRIAVGLGATKRVYAGDDGGTMWALDPTTATTFGGTPLWSFNTANAIKSSPYYDTGTDTVQYGTQGGTIIVLNGSGAKLNAGYPYTPAGGSGDPITSAPLYYNGVLAVGSTGGKLYFLDRNTGSSLNPIGIIREYQFGSAEAVSGIGFDPTANRYMVSTASSSGDGRLYYIDLITDPTPGVL